MEELATDKKTNPHAREVLEELIPLARGGKIIAWRYVDTSGHAHPKYENGQLAGYVVAYQGGKESTKSKESIASRMVNFLGELFGHKVGFRGTKEEAVRIGNLVHELTHVAVSESLERDFVDYIHEDQPTEKLLPMKPTDSGWANQGALTERQGEWGVQAADEELGGNASRLLEAFYDVKEVKLWPKEKKADWESLKLQVRTKIEYAIGDPRKEYDPSLNQILIWCQFWQSDRNTEFYKMLTQLVHEAYERRKNATPLSTGAPGGAGAEGAVA